MVYKFSDKRSSGGAIKPKSNYQLTNELHRQIIRKFRKRKVHLFFRDNIWGVDMLSLSKYNKGIKYLLCAIDLFREYAWIVHLKEKRGISIVNAFLKVFRHFKQKTK